MAVDRPMRIAITGAGGFVGRAFVRALAADHAIVAIDRTGLDFGDLPQVRSCEGDLTDTLLLAAAFARPCDAVIHLATVPGGAAEDDPAHAKAVNVDATMALIDAAAQSGGRPRFLFASSIAVFGDPLPAHVDDATPVAPRMLYGAHKAMMEEWIAVMTRRGAIDGLSLRLPGIVARPRGPSGMKSAFLSDLFHALKAREPITLPVSPGATCWLLSLPAVVAAFVHALTLPAAGRVTLPALRVMMADLVAETVRQTDADAALVHYAPDPAIEAAFGSQPPLTTARGDALGFRHDGDPATLVAHCLANIL